MAKIERIDLRTELRRIAREMRAGSGAYDAEFVLRAAAELADLRISVLRALRERDWMRQQWVAEIVTHRECGYERATAEAEGRVKRAVQAYRRDAAEQIEPFEPPHERQAIDPEWDNDAVGGGGDRDADRDRRTADLDETED